MLPLALWSGGAVAWSVVANLLWPADAVGYVIRNVFLAIACLVVGLRTGASATQLGLAPARLSAGLVWGTLAAGIVAICVLAGLAVSGRIGFVEALLGDRRARLPGDALAFAALVRIPVGTALFEEVLFRGVLLSVSLRRMPPTAAVVVSSAVFGLWHVAPTAVTLDSNGLDPVTLVGLAAIAGSVLLTSLAGGAFAWLRLRSGSLVAPMLAHWSTNAMGLLAAASS